MSQIGLRTNSAGDPYLYLEVNATASTAFGIDDSDSDKLKISHSSSTGNSPSSTASFTLTTDGERNLPLQPAFLASSPSLTSVSGDGTTYSLGASSALTEIADQGGDFTVGDGAGTAATYTAPVTGYHILGFLCAWHTETTGGSFIYHVIDFTSSRRPVSKSTSICSIHVRLGCPTPVVVVTSSSDGRQSLTPRSILDFKASI